MVNIKQEPYKWMVRFPFPQVKYKIFTLLPLQTFLFFATSNLSFLRHCTSIKRNVFQLVLVALFSVSTTRQAEMFFTPFRCSAVYFYKTRKHSNGQWRQWRIHSKPNKKQVSSNKQVCLTNFMSTIVFLSYIHKGDIKAWFVDLTW